MHKKPVNQTNGQAIREVACDDDEVKEDKLIKRQLDGY